MRSSSSRSEASVVGLASAREFWVSTLCSGTAALPGYQLLMSTGSPFPGSLPLMGRGKAPQGGECHAVADRILVEMLLRVVAHPEIGELQFEGLERGGERHVPVLVGVLVDVLQVVVAEAGRDREALIDRI